MNFVCENLRIVAGWHAAVSLYHGFDLIVHHHLTLSSPQPPGQHATTTIHSYPPSTPPTKRAKPPTKAFLLFYSLFCFHITRN